MKMQWYEWCRSHLDGWFVEYMQKEGSNEYACLRTAIIAIYPLPFLLVCSVLSRKRGQSSDNHSMQNMSTVPLPTLSVLYGLTVLREISVCFQEI